MSKADLAAYMLLAGELEPEDAIHRGWEWYCPHTEVLERERRRPWLRGTFRSVPVGALYFPRVEPPPLSQAVPLAPPLSDGSAASQNRRCLRSSLASRRVPWLPHCFSLPSSAAHVSLAFYCRPRQARLQVPPLSVPPAHPLTGGPMPALPLAEPCPARDGKTPLPVCPSGRSEAPVRRADPPSPGTSRDRPSFTSPSAAVPNETGDHHSIVGRMSSDPHPSGSALPLSTH
jgi:hypothetical protein